MSLVSLSSNSAKVQYLTQRPFDFSNHFPQPIILEPDSEVCLTNLTFGSPGDDNYEIRGSQNPSINDGNNKFMISFGDKGYYGQDIILLRDGSYTGAQLATEIARALNEQCKFEYYQFSCVFAQGNPVANPPENDTFTISYTERPNYRFADLQGKGTWTKNRIDNIVSDNTTITDGGTLGGLTHACSKIQIIDAAQPSANPNLRAAVAQAYGAQKGIPFYTQDIGGAFVEGTVHFFGQGTSLTGDPEVEEKIIGIASPAQLGRCAYDNNIEDDADIDYDAYGNPMMQFYCRTFRSGSGVNMLDIVYGTPNAYDAQQIGNNIRPRILRRVNLTGIITAKTDVLIVRISTFYRARAYIVQLLSSTTGDSFSLVAPATGGNNDQQFLDGSTDDKQKVYTETMFGLATGAADHPPAFTGCVYSTIGVPTNPAVTGIGSARETASIYNNGHVPQIALSVPFIELDRNNDDLDPQNVITDLNLGNDTGDSPSTYQMDLNAGQGTTATNRYTIQFNNDNTNGYDGTISIAVAPTTTDDSAVPTAQINGTAYKKTSRQVNKWLLYANNTAPQAGAASIGQIIVSANLNSVNITSTGFTAGHPFIATLIGDAPSIITEPSFSLVSVVENTRDSLLFSDGKNMRNGRYQFYMNGNTPDERGGTIPGLPYGDDPEDRIGAAQEAASGAVAAGSTLNEVFSGRLGRITQEEVDLVGENAPMRRLRYEEQLEASLGRTIGYSELSFQNGLADRDIVGTLEPLRDASQKERTVHVSIPELSNVKSLEGESNQRYKTIKVIPKDSFSEDQSASLLTYEANYEDYIKINNGRQAQINELSVQLRQPDGTLADWVKGDCRATIKFRESPEKAQMRMFDRLAERLTQQQNPGQEILVKPNDFVGS